MSDNPTVRRAANVIQHEFGGYHALQDQSVGRTVDSCALARALAAAGLLDDPTTPTVTDEQADNSPHYLLDRLRRYSQAQANLVVVTTEDMRMAVTEIEAFHRLTASRSDR